jgi:ribosomal protein S18 acetylase RimI-like enzyme
MNDEERFERMLQQLLNLILNHPNVIVSSISKIYLSVDSNNSIAIHIYKKYKFEVM